MEKLWAPWRIEYIKKADKTGCIFCEALKNPDEKYVVKISKKAFVILNAYPYNSGHVMIAPIAHKAEFKDLTQEEILDIFELITQSIEVLREKINPHGFNIGVNIGRCAGAGIRDHLHIHIVPRWEGDTNFMPVLGDTKVIPQALKETQKILKEGFKEKGWL